MRTRERAILWTLVLGLAVIQLPNLFRGTVAVAGHLGLDDLVGTRLVLEPAAGGDTEDAEAIALENRGGRLAWGERPTHAVRSIAFVNDRRIIDRLMKSPERVEGREAMRADLDREAEAFRERLRELEQRAEGIDPDSPEFEALFREWNQAGEAFQQWQEQARQRAAALEAEYLQEAYGELVVAVEIVADELDVDVVLRSIPPTEDFESEDPGQTSLLIRMRTALKFPGDLDITRDVADELAVDLDDG